MEYRRFGKSGLQVSLFSFGSWVSFHKQIGDGAADELMSIAYDNGINFFDNAETYALGESEKMMGRVLKSKSWERSSYIVSSKAFFGWRKPNKPNQTGLSRKHLTEACHEALQRLQVEYLDLYFCHRPDRNVPIEEVVQTMNTLIQQGKIFYWGTSEWMASEIMEAHVFAQKNNLIGPTMEQPEYNMFRRDYVEKEYDHLYKTMGLGTTIWSPLAAGVLTGKYNDGIPEGSRLAIEGFSWLKDKQLSDQKINKVKMLQPIAESIGATLTTLALAWCAKNPNVSTVILGATKASQLQENLLALEVLPNLTEDVMQKIEEVLANKPSIEQWA